MAPDEIIFRDVIRHVMGGARVAPRGLPIREVENFHVNLPPRCRWMTFEARRFKLDYLKAELRWYLKGDPADLSIAQHAGLWSTITNPDGTVNSNYGAYLFREGQFWWVIDELRRDPDSRRASVVILRPEFLREGVKDVPCTYGLNLRVREGRVNMSVHMRSQDMIWGAGNDIPTFSIVQEMAGACLGLPVGTYHHCVDSAHIYERHWRMAEEIIALSPWRPVEVPVIRNEEEVRDLIAGRQTDAEFNRWLHS